MYPNEKLNKYQHYNHQRFPDETYQSRDQISNSFIPINQPPQFSHHPSQYPLQSPMHGQFIESNPQSFVYPNNHQYSQMGVQYSNSFPIHYNQAEQNIRYPPIDILKEIAMLGRFLDLSPDEKGKDPTERKKKIVKDEKEIHLGNIIFKTSKGDWQCKEKTCGNWNYAKREKCNKCKKRKTEDGAHIKNEKKMSRKFWSCEDCHFQNFEYKEKCYKCGVSKNDIDQLSGKHESSVKSKTNESFAFERQK